MKNLIRFFEKSSRRLPIGNDKGMVMAIILMLVAVLVILGTTGILTVTTDMKISSNFRENARALYDAEAGVNAVIAKVNDGTFTWPATGNSQVVTVACPSDFKFNGCAGAGTTSVTVTNVDGTYYQFQVTGYGYNNAAKTIEVRFKRKPAFDFGLFADGVVDLKASGQVYSYNSNVTPNPTTTDSLHNGDVGSNTEIVGYNGTLVDGDAGLGASAGGTTATLNIKSGTVITGTSGTEVGRVDPDPLGAVGGELSAKFTTYSATNDNTLTGTTGVSGTVINGGATLVGKPGGANYYISSLTLGNRDTLTVDTTNGPVNIYMTGELEAKNGSLINVTGSTLDFSIFSNSTDKIVFKHGSAFKGVVYAPYAPIEMKNSADTYGLIWGGSIDIKNSGQFYFDEALNDKFLSKKVTVASWKDVM
ncbi:MAG TPA: PilX N-terminal domain-containing pilus assembly protein [Prolixibacteraceae bacterium]|nr:PilX N-terminal domain-containing pilus assembly protein [Prolixibacteraceae bacterium]